MLFQQHPALAHGHTTPNSVVYFVVECVGQAFGSDGTVSAYIGGLALGRSINEELVGIDGTTGRL